MNYTSAKNPVFTDASNKTIALLVKFEHIDQEVKFIAAADDCEEHGREIYQRACAGDFGAIAPYVEPVMSHEQTVQAFKQWTTSLLEQKAKELGFLSLADALTYCDEPSVPLYQQQALALRAWRSLVWAKYDEVILSEFDLEQAAASMPEYPSA